VRGAAVALAALIALAAARPASAHGMRSVYLDLTQTAAGRARVAIRSNLAVTGVARRAPRLARTAVRVGAYAVGGTGAFWLCERLAAL
jgi:hypothetical protein